MADVLAVQARRLSYAIHGRTILDDIDLDLAPGQSLAVTGPSGSGKTTLLMCLAGLLAPTAGSVRIGSAELTGLRSKARSALRLASVGIVYQFGELLPELTPLENVALPALLKSTRRREAYSRAETLLADLGVGDLATASTATLSGGERQRVAVARALVTEPRVILADEPTGSLDRSSAEVVADLLFGLPRRYECAMVIVTHNDRIAGRADRKALLDCGCLVEAGS